MRRRLSLIFIMGLVIACCGCAGYIGYGTYYDYPYDYNYPSYYDYDDYYYPHNSYFFFRGKGEEREGHGIHERGERHEESGGHEKRR